MIAFAIICWLVVAGIILTAAGGIEFESAIMIFFWPISLPILLGFGAIYCVWVCILNGIDLFRGQA